MPPAQTAEAGQSEVGHFEPGGTHWDQTPKGRAAEVRAFAVWLLGIAFARTELFREQALEVAEDESRAEKFAFSYARSGAGKQVVVLMLITASRAPQNLVETRLMNLGFCGAFEDAPLEPGDARYALRPATVESMWRGAQIVAWRGAGLCVRCGQHHDRDDDYCASCSPKTMREVRSDDNLARQVLRQAAEGLGIESAGPQHRRRRDG